jgi:hypothetical protein
MDPVMTWGWWLFGAFCGASPAYILGAAITRRKQEDTMTRLQEAQIELAWAQRAEQNAAKTEDMTLKAEWEAQAKAAREAAAMLMEDAEVEA